MEIQHYLLTLKNYKQTKIFCKLTKAFTINSMSRKIMYEEKLEENYKKISTTNLKKIMHNKRMQMCIISVWTANKRKNWIHVLIWIKEACYLFVVLTKSFCQQKIIYFIKFVGNCKKKIRLNSFGIEFDK